jgi:hypothetical protein
MFSLDSRGALLIAAGVIALVTYLALTWQLRQLAILSLIDEGLFAIGWLAGATGIGFAVLCGIDRLDKSERAERKVMLAFVTSAALGIGAISLIVLGLGLAGWFNRTWAIGILAAGWAVLVGQLLVRQGEVRVGDWFSKRMTWQWMWIMLAPLAAMTIVAAFLPPGLLWGDEPNGYDVVEYHLQVPREWYEAGKIEPLNYNVYSFMPFNVEMHYLLAMHLRGGPWEGMYLAQLMHVIMCALAALAVYALAEGKAAGVIAGGLVAATPWTGLLAPVAYNEGGELLFGALAIGWLLRAKSRRDYLIAGAFAGLAAGVKLPMVPLLFVGLPLVVAVTRRSMRGCILYLTTATLFFSPWLIRNFVWAHNPVFPELMDWLGQAHFSHVQVVRWHLANELPDIRHQGIVGRLQALREQVLSDWRYGWILLPMGLLAWLLAIAMEKPAAIALGILLVFQTAIWLFFSHVQSRFMVMTIPISAMLIGQITDWRWITAGAAALIAMCGISTTLIFMKLPHADVICPPDLDGMRPLVVGTLPADANVDLVGDAYIFCYQLPMTRLHYKTVFDVDTSDLDKSIIDDWLTGMPKDALMFVDKESLNRFARTYYRIPPLPAPALPAGSTVADLRK